MSKKTIINKELKNLSAQELIVKIDSLRRELFSLRLHSVSTPQKDVKQYGKLRKDIARGMTYLQFKLNEQ